MRVVQCRFSDGKRVPVLFRDAPPQPVLVPFLYVHGKRRYKAYNTKRNDLEAIQAFYEYHESRDADVDEALIGCQFDSLLKSLDGFAAWIESGRRTNKLAGIIGKQANEGRIGIAPQTRDGYFRAIKLFLNWAAQKYVPRIHNSDDINIERAFEDISAVIRTRFESYALAPSGQRVDFRALTEKEIDAVRVVVDVKSPINPFRRQNRLRNWVIIESLLESGFRVGELLKLKSADIQQVENRYYLTVLNREEDPEDSRSKEPSLKNENAKRTVAISGSLYNAIQYYIERERRPLRNGKPMKLTHGYLIVSERGSPLSVDSVNRAFQKIRTVVAKQLGLPDFDLSPHSCRHTFSDTFMAYLIDVRKLDMERAKDELRTICGWSEYSTMPAYYARRYITKSANEHNAKRIEAAWKRLSGEDLKF